MEEKPRSQMSVPPVTTKSVRGSERKRWWKVRNKGAGWVELKGEKRIEDCKDK